MSSSKRRIESDPGSQVGFQREIYSTVLQLSPFLWSSEWKSTPLVGMMGGWTHCSSWKRRVKSADMIWEFREGKSEGGFSRRQRGWGGERFYSRRIGAFGPGAEGAGRKTASVEEQERRESAEGRCFHRGCCPPNRWGWGTKAKNLFWFSLFSCSLGCKPASVPYLNTHYWVNIHFNFVYSVCCSQNCL